MKLISIKTRRALSDVWKLDRSKRFAFEFTPKIWKLSDSDMPINPYTARLKMHGHRITPKVRAVIGLFLKRQCVLDPLEVRTRLQRQFRGVGLPTIYRILESLADCGILLTARNEDRQLRYYICREIEHEHHHHFICRKCGKVEEVNLCLIEDVSTYVKRHLKAKVESHFLQVEGLCSKCMAVTPR